MAANHYVGGVFFTAKLSKYIRIFAKRQKYQQPVGIVKQKNTTHNV
jgi:hypothetical protein